MNVHIIRTNGDEERVNVPFHAIGKLVGADLFDTVSLRDGRVMLVDDSGLIDGKPLNPKATAMYHGVCKPGTVHPIAGDVAIVVDAEVE